MWVSVEIPVRTHPSVLALEVVGNKVKLRIVINAILVPSPLVAALVVTWRLPVPWLLVRVVALRGRLPEQAALAVRMRILLLRHRHRHRPVSGLRLSLPVGRYHLVWALLLRFLRMVLACVGREAGQASCRICFAGCRSQYTMRWRLRRVVPRRLLCLRGRRLRRRG